MPFRKWLSEIPGAWIGVMEATMFTGWIYDFLKPYALELKVAPPEMLRAITAAKRRMTKLTRRGLPIYYGQTFCRNVTWLPKTLGVGQDSEVPEHDSAYFRKDEEQDIRLLMEVGAPYNKKRLHGRKYFNELEKVEDVPPSVNELLKLSRSGLEMLQDVQRKLLDTLHDNALIRERVRRLLTIDGIGEVTALTWVLRSEIPTDFICTSGDQLPRIMQCPE